MKKEVLKVMLQEQQKAKGMLGSHGWLMDLKEDEKSQKEELQIKEKKKRENRDEKYRSDVQVKKNYSQQPRLPQLDYQLGW